MKQISMTIQQMLQEPVADLRGGVRGMRAPPLDQNFFIFMQFSGKIGQIIGWCPPPLGLVPPPLGNPGSATGNSLRTRTNNPKKEILYLYCQWKPHICRIKVDKI